MCESAPVGPSKPIFSKSELRHAHSSVQEKICQMMALVGIIKKC
jgi:hypothetical protein